MSSATKKFALATLTTPVLAALAIGLAGSATAAPAGPQPSDTGTTTTANPDGSARAANATAASPTGRTTRGATQRKPLLGRGPMNIKELLESAIVLRGGRPSVSPARPRLLGGERGYYNMIGDDSVKWIVQGR
jgi:hypothetical protein